MSNMFQEIFNKVQDYLPEEWDKLVFYAAYLEGSYSIKYFIKSSNGNYVDCYNAINIPSIKLTKLFISLDKVISPYRNHLADDKKWSVMTMIIESDGNVKIDYEYKNISDKFVEYEKNWNQTYLV